MDAEVIIAGGLLSSFFLSAAAVAAAAALQLQTMVAVAIHAVIRKLFKIHIERRCPVCVLAIMAVSG